SAALWRRGPGSRLDRCARTRHCLAQEIPVATRSQRCRQPRAFPLGRQPGASGTQPFPVGRGQSVMQISGHWKQREKTMTDEQILEKLKAILEENFEIAPIRVVPEAHLFEELDLD